MSSITFTFSARVSGIAQEGWVWMNETYDGLMLRLLVYLVPKETLVRALPA
jgi:hypothetical protein